MNIIKNNLNVSTKSKIITICQMRSTNNKQFNQNQIQNILEESKKQNSSVSISATRIRNKNYIKIFN